MFGVRLVLKGSGDVVYLSYEPEITPLSKYPSMIQFQ